MCRSTVNNNRIGSFSQTEGEELRRIDPEDISVPAGYRIEVYAERLDSPSCILFTGDGNLLIAESGYISNKPRILLLSSGEFEIIAENFNAPITGITMHEEDLYVSHRGVISVIRADGSRQDIITGLPSFGDHYNNNIVFGNDGRLYFGQGTVTNSGVVGLDNGWVMERPFICDSPGGYIMMNGQNFETENILGSRSEMISTGAFSPYGVPNLPFEVKKGNLKASGSILRVNPDGTNLELVAWGFRNPYIKFDAEYNLFATNNGYHARGSRPISNAPDTFQYVVPGVWYGWPDFADGEPVTSARFVPEGGRQPQFLLTNHPNHPPRAFSTFPAGSNILGFVFDYTDSFGTYGDVYIAEFGAAHPLTVQATTPYTGIGHRVSRINMVTGGVATFAINKSGFPANITGERGFGRPVDVAFGPDEALYVLDMGTNPPNDPGNYIPFTGVIWRILREE